MPYRDKIKQKQYAHEWYLENKNIVIERVKNARKRKPSSHESIAARKKI